MRIGENRNLFGTEMSTDGKGSQMMGSFINQSLANGSTGFTKGEEGDLNGNLSKRSHSIAAGWSEFKASK